jgi:hypothetical protein
VRTGCLQLWAEAHLVAAAEVEPPEAVRAVLEEQVRYPYTKGPMRLTLVQLVGWLAAGLRSPVLGAVAGWLARGSDSRP